jgi:alpha-tubulin suppressor-like RCC1 family protein
VVDPENVVYCWGDNAKSQLGQAMAAAAEIAATPVAIGKLAATSLALGRDFSLALTADGVRAWGQNAFGQLGTGTSMPSLEPTPSSGIQADVALLVSGPCAAHACALGDGSLGCWGANPLGELGDGTMLDRYQSVRVSLPKAVKLATAPGSVALGKAHSCAIDTSGGIWCWGGNQRRQLGPQVLEDTATTPVRVY